LNILGGIKMTNLDDQKLELLTDKKVF
jgi:hypothetical protein